MASAHLTFLLPEDRSQHLCAINGLRFYATLLEVDNHLRHLLKHGGIAAYSAERLAEDIRARISQDLGLVEEV